MPTATYREVARIPSASNRSKEYIIKVDEQNRLSCSCPAWRFLNGRGTEGLRFCKHLKKYNNDRLGISNDEE